MVGSKITHLAEHRPPRSALHQRPSRRPRAAHRLRRSILPPAPQPPTPEPPTGSPAAPTPLAMDAPEVIDGAEMGRVSWVSWWLAARQAVLDRGPPHAPHQVGHERALRRGLHEARDRRRAVPPASRRTPRPFGVGPELIRVRRGGLILESKAKQNKKRANTHKNVRKIHLTRGDMIFPKTQSLARRREIPPGFHLPVPQPNFHPFLPSLP